MASPQDIIKEMVGSLHQNHLKALGFRKSGTTWVRPLSWPQVINVQLSRWNSASEASFTVNLGISVGDLHVASEELPLKGSLKEHDCDVRARIGQLIPSGEDKWWKVIPSSDPEQLAEDLHAHLVQFVLPWFERLRDYPALAAEYTTRKMMFMAALAFHFAGDQPGAEKAMNEAMAQANIHWQPKIKRIALAIGIPIKE